jgi:ribosomal protein L14
MLQLLTRVKVVDNSGVILGRIIKILTPKNAKLGRMGSLIIISSKVQTKNSGILPGTKLKALIIRTKYGNKEFTHKIK